MTPREALEELRASSYHVGECDCSDCDARAVLLRTIEQHEAAVTELRAPKNWLITDGDDGVWVSHGVMVDALTKGNP